MSDRYHPLSLIERDKNHKCRFLNLREAITLYPEDNRLSWLTNRLHNYEAIRYDLRKAHNLLGEVIRFQSQEKLLASPFLFSAGWFHAVILYARWFKATEKRPRLDDDFFDNRTDLLEKHKYFIDVRDKYIAHYEKEIIGKMELYLTFSLEGELLELSPLGLEVYVQSKHDLYDLSKLIEFVYNKINNKLLPKFKRELIEYMKNKPEFNKLFEKAELAEDVKESKVPTPYDYEIGFNDIYKT